MAEVSQEPPSGSGIPHPAIWAYTVVCLTALLVIAVMLTQEGSGIFGLLPVVVGTGALLARWSIGPPLVLFLVGGFYLNHPRPPRFLGGILVEGEVLTGMLLTAVLVVYVAGSYRLQSLTQQLVPLDIRPLGRANALKLKRWFQPELSRVRPPEAVRTGEIVWLIVGSGIVAILAAVGWLALVANLFEPPFQLPWLLAVGMVLVWVFGLVLAVSGAILAYLGARSATREESLLFLQDQAWRQTRAEQSQQHRWWVWGWLQGQARKKDHKESP